MGGKEHWERTPRQLVRFLLIFTSEWANRKKSLKTCPFPEVWNMSWLWLFILFLSLVWMVVTNAQHLH